MKSNIFLRVIISCFVVLFTLTCKASDFAPQEALDFASTKGKELLLSFQEPDLSKRYKKLDSLFLEYIDVDYVSKFVMGKYWRSMTAEQQKAYKEIFIRYGLAFYKTLPLEYAKGLTYKIINAEKDGKFVNVSTNVQVNIGKEKQNIALIFRLHKVDNKIKAVDVKIAESSLLLSYRGKFYEMIAECDDEIDWFLTDLSDLASSYEKNLRENVLNQQNSLELGDENR